MSKRMIYECYKHFQDYCIDIEDNELPGCTNTSKADEKLEPHNLGISIGSCYDVLGMESVVAQFAPRFLEFEGK